MNQESLTSYPAPSRRSAVLAANGMVATSQPLAAQSGLNVLREGGNAVDAALATAAVLTVVEPTSNGIGSDAFAIVWDGSRLHGLNGSGRWPRSLDRDQVRAAGHTTMPEGGWFAVTVPGAPAAWDDLHRRFGSISLERILAPAIRYAEDGFPVSPVISELWARAAAIFNNADERAALGWPETFTAGGSPPAAGQRWRSPGHAACFRGLAERGIRDFYEGQIADAIVAYARETGGFLGREDLGAHGSEWIEPISVSYRELEVWELPPNGPGIGALQALGMMDGFDLGSRVGAEAWHVQIEAMKLAFSDVYGYVADPQHVTVPVRGLIEPGYLAQRRALIGDRAGPAPIGNPPGGGTVYLCAADGNGMMVSFIQSNYMGFGSGVVLPSLGISFQNRAAGFTLDSDHPNVAAPGKRPRHTIIPGFLTRSGAAVGPFGIMGGEMQPQAHVQVVSAMVDFGLNCQAALDMPRWQILGAGEASQIALEPHVDPKLRAGLEVRGHRVTTVPERFAFGRGQIIQALPDGVLVAGSEPRTDGAAVGW